MSETVLVTGAFGLVGSAMVKRLAADGRRVIATGRNSVANRRAAQRLPAGVQVHWADLTDAAAVDRLVFEVAPIAIIHLAAVIPPAIYRDARFARKVNVEGTAALVRSAEMLPNPPPVPTRVELRCLRRTQPVSKPGPVWSGHTPEPL